jgi:hypothetical protein
MKISEYIDNPYGKGSAFVNRKVIYADLINRYYALTKKYKMFTNFIYKDGKDYYCHIRIPSESIEEMTYDVIIFINHSSSIIKNNEFKVFSNCPSFVFTYAYVFNKNKMLIDFLRGQFDDPILSEDPMVRNPNRVLGYEKSIFYALNYLINHFIYTSTLDVFAKKFVMKDVLKRVRDDQLILLQYNRNKRKQELRQNQKFKTTIQRVVPRKEEEPKKIFHRIEPKEKLSVKNKIKPSITKKEKITAKKKR